MILRLVVKAGTSMESIEQVGDDNYVVHLSSKPIKGRANEELLTLLSKFFKIPKSSITILRGEHSKNKLVKIG